MIFKTAEILKKLELETETTNKKDSEFILAHEVEVDCKKRHSYNIFYRKLFFLTKF